MLKADDNEEVSLRPLSLRPGTAAKNPFASFGKGAGAAFRDKVRLASGWYCTAASALICYHSALDMLGRHSCACDYFPQSNCTAELTLAWIQPKEDIFAPPVEEKRKPRGEVVKYSIDFLHSLSEACPIFII